MVFPSPLYLDPPNWQQHPNNQQVLQGGGSGGNHHDQNNHLIPPAPLPQPSGSSRMTQMGMGSGAGGGPGGPASRPNSMAEMARRAKISPPETLPCPRCESTNTKFCYFNNYSLQQPRHFCKTCRRYWTNGGALRNVPVGGGCRRNKRSSSKSTSGGSGGGGGGSSSKSSLTSPTTLVGGDRISLHMDLATTSGLGPIFPVLPSGGGSTGMSSFMASLQNIAMGNLGLSFGGGLSPPPPHPLGGLGGLTTTTTHGGGGGVGGAHHLDFPQLNPISTNPQVQFPNFLAGFELPTSSPNPPDGSRLYSSTLQNDPGIIDGDQNNNQDGNNSLPKNCSSEMDSQFASIKTENDAQGLNLHKQFMNMASNSATSNQFWGGNIENNNTNEGTNTLWNDLSGHNSSSTSHLL